MANDYDFDTVSVSVIYEKLTKAGVTPSDAKIIAGQWIVSQAGRDLRVFAYSSALAQVEAACAAHFQRSFAHADWKDGESVVQAEETTVEEGFNKRFHAIENDLDALGVDVKKAFQCLAELRATLKTLLDEIRTEFNRINKDVYDCCRHDKVVFPWPGGQVTTYPGNLPVWEGGRFAGMVDVYGQPRQLWETKYGTFVLPAGPIGGGSSPWEDDRVKRTTELSRVLSDNANVKKLFAAGPVTKADFVKKFGDDLSPGGVRIRALVDILPAESSFPTGKAMLDAVVEREAAAIRTSGASAAARTAAFGIGSEIETMADARIDQFGAIPTAQRTALVAAGITTLGKLDAAEVGAISSALKKGGLAATPGEIGGWQAAAKTMMLSGA